MAAADHDVLALPPGFRFHPTDEEIITHYLSPKVLNQGFSARAMGEVDLNKCEPWDLPSKAKMGEKEWYFFCQRDRKYPTGMRTNRATESGYWKATGKDKEIYRGRGMLVGMKKTLVFYKGRAPKGEKTNWVMHEFRLEGNPPPLSLHLPKSAKDEWVVCRVFHKNAGLKRTPMAGGSFVRLNSFTDGLMDSPTLPPLMETPCFTSGPPDDGLDFKAVMAMPPYFSSMMAVDDLNPNPPIAPTNPYLLIPPESSGRIRGHEENRMSPAIRRHCKAEQFSNQSMLSQDTGISTEISSVMSKHGSTACYEDFDVLSTAAAGALDFHGMWRC
ncbi:hypothetical protein HPP92_014363 [Vanilla planifolia]|uniref:NAC domain-containing protein n=1 Tax=Vanilla planifolia TaxID=51239 RepID=A0A835R166_VANPL|nr:hypothetical protein HPP92_014363 [Vanilla planifolia]